MTKEELLELIHEKTNEIFLAYQEANGITDGGISPLDHLKLEGIEEQLATLIEKIYG